MADQCHTPPASATPSTETPETEGAAAGVQRVRAKREPERSWSRQVALDFVTVKRNVGLKIQAKENTGKWSSLTAEEQRHFTELEIENELKRRERNKSTTTARADHPETWQNEYERVVQEWVSALKREHARATRVAAAYRRAYIEDRDDEEEEMPKQGIKFEPECDTFQDAETRNSSPRKTRPKGFYEDRKEESPLSDVPSSVEDDDENDKEEESDEDEAPKKTNKKRKFVECTACTRGLGIIIGCSGSKNKKARVTRNAKAEAEPPVTKGEVSNGGNLAGGATKRCWKWVDGVLVVWPERGW